MRWYWQIGLVAAGAATLGGCGDESPLSVGSEVVGEGVRTVQVVYDATAFLQGDRVYDQIGSLNEAAFGIIATDFGGDLDAHVLLEIDRPLTVSYEDTTGAVVRDTIASVQGGTLTVLVDSLSAHTGPIDVELVDVVESFDPGTVSWTERADTAGVTELWTTPGGTPGQVLASGTWVSGDTLVIPLDSAAAAVWDDTAADVNWGMLRLATTGARLRVQAVNFTFDVTPTGLDTSLVAGRVLNSVPVAPEPPGPTAGTLRVGGLPVWRSLLHFVPLDTLPVPCEQGATQCSVALSDVTVTTANLLLWTQPMGGYRTERDMRVEGRAVLEGPTVPLSRAPLSGPFAQTGDVVSAGAFEAPAAVMTRVPITGFVQRNSNVGEDDAPVLWLALTAVAERAVFGYGEFGGPSSGTPPQLEVVVTVPVREVNQ